jgi:hypothetical protein
VKLYQRIASTLCAIENCEKSGNTEWFARHRDAIETLCKAHLPHGSGFDSGCTLQDQSTPNRLIFSADFHHMDENGYYAGWGEYRVIVSADLAFGFKIRVTGRDRNMIKDYIADTFHYVMSINVE